MPAFVLHVSLPDRRKLTWTVPNAVQGQSAHYLFDISRPNRKKLSAGSRVFLWGTKRVGKNGLFASARCEIPDDVSVKGDKEFDAFVLLRHERVLRRPIAPQTLATVPGLSTLVSKVEASTLLEFIALDEEQECKLDRAMETEQGST